MKSPSYVEEILDETWRPFTSKVFPDGYRFQQDDDPKHKSGLTLAHIVEKGIPYWPTPSESPDLKLIETMWNEMKYFLCKTWKPTVKDKLIAGIQAFWKTMTAVKCARYINHNTRLYRL